MVLAEALHQLVAALAGARFVRRLALVHMPAHARVALLGAFLALRRVGRFGAHLLRHAAAPVGAVLACFARGLHVLAHFLALRLALGRVGFLAAGLHHHAMAAHRPLARVGGSLR